MAGPGWQTIVIFAPNTTDGVASRHSVLGKPHLGEKQKIHMRQGFLSSQEYGFGEAKFVFGDVLGENPRKKGREDAEKGLQRAM